MPAVFAGVYPASPAWAFLVELLERQVAVAEPILKGRMVWEPEPSSHPSAHGGTLGDMSSLWSPPLPPLGDACVGLSDFSQQCLNSFPLWGKWLSCSNNIVAAAAGWDLGAFSFSGRYEEGLVSAQGTSFPVIACHLSSIILPPCKSCFACYLDRNPVGPVVLHISPLW